MKVRLFNKNDLKQMIDIWNEVVEEGIAFPQEDFLDEESGNIFFSAQTCTVVIEDEESKIYGLYILHPNNIGRCGHIANSSYAVNSNYRGKNIGEKLVLDSIERAKEYGFKILQFNDVVESNFSARHLYEKLGFKQLGVIPNGFRDKNGIYNNICPYYIEL